MDSGGYSNEKYVGEMGKNNLMKTQKKLQKFYFEVVVKKGTTHVSVDHLSRLIMGEDPTGVEDYLLDAY